ncbi:MAG: aspartate-semialdehyde dehydrogenase [Oscillospiraceae bacterium]|nr:aspartate-semialdehyde dehydrogenase [Oscillospiraceae bacterium]
MKTYKLAVVGATGMVGAQTLKVLEERNLPISEYIFYASSRSAGKKIIFMGNEHTIVELSEENIDSTINFALFAAGSDISQKYIPIFKEKGCIVIDKSSLFRMDEEVPLIVPEVNPEEISNHKGLIATPNCTTIPAVAVLKPLDSKYKIKRVIYSTYQAVSGAGGSAVADLKNGEQKIAPKNFPVPIYSNCIPQIDSFLDSGYTKEEMKTINETRKILKRPDLKVTATTVRVPVFNCHSESINVEFENDFEIEDIKNILSSSAGVVVQDDFSKGVYPTAFNVDGKDEVYVGRIRRDESIQYGLNIWVVSDNLRKGAATNAIQILEKLIENDL